MTLDEVEVFLDDPATGESRGERLTKLPLVDRAAYRVLQTYRGQAGFEETRYGNKIRLAIDTLDETVFARIKTVLQTLGGLN